MSTNHPERRFVPRLQFPVTETDDEESSETPVAFPFSLNDQSTNNPAGQTFDEALEQIASEGWCVSPLRGDSDERWICGELRTIRPDLASGTFSEPDPSVPV